MVIRFPIVQRRQWVMIPLLKSGKSKSVNPDLNSSRFLLDRIQSQFFLISATVLRSTSKLKQDDYRQLELFLK